MSAPWFRLARAQAGVVSRSQLLALGVQARAVARRVERGDLVRLAPGVYRVAAAPDTPDTALWVATLATGGHLTGASACWVWGHLDVPPAVVRIVVPPARKVVAPPGVVVNRQPVPPSALTRERGLPATTPAWSLLDEIARRELAPGVELCDRALQRRWLTLREIDRHLQEWSGRTGNPRLREVRRIVGDGARAQSERLLLELLADAGVTGWRPNARVATRTGTVEADVLFEHARLVVEVDGLAWHTTRDRFERDRARQNALVNAGYRVLRFTWSRLVHDPEGVLAEIDEALADRGGRFLEVL